MSFKDKTRTNKLTIDTITLLQTMHWMAWRQNNTPVPIIGKDRKIKGLRTPPPGSRKGVPDILAISPHTGVLHGFEIKVGDDKLSLDQLQFMNDMLKVCAVYITISSIDDVIVFLDDYRVQRM